MRPSTKEELESNQRLPIIDRASSSLECLVVNEQSKTIKTIPEQNLFSFDFVFSPSSSQNEVYAALGRPLVDDVVQGVNATIFTYGQTGSGKTYTLFGDLPKPSSWGIIPRVAQDFFKVLSNEKDLESFQINLGLVEIYKEKLFDLLTFFEIPVTRKDLVIRDNLSKGVTIEGLRQVQVDSACSLIENLGKGEQLRHKRMTKMNQNSSRSHTICFIEVLKQRTKGQALEKSMMKLVDLAGSEKMSKSGGDEESFGETKQINLSLTCLGRVILALSDEKCLHVPYRESKLTRILRDSLGGSCRTSIVVTCSKDWRQKEETISALNFAKRAKKIENEIIKEEIGMEFDMEGFLRQMNQLKIQLKEAQMEISSLKSMNEVQWSLENEQKRGRSQLGESKGRKGKKDLADQRRNLEKEQTPLPRQLNYSVLLSKALGKGSEMESHAIETSQKSFSEMEVEFLRRELEITKREMEAQELRVAEIERKRQKDKEIIGFLEKKLEEKKRKAA